MFAPLKFSIGPVSFTKIPFLTFEKPTKIYVSKWQVYCVVKIHKNGVEKCCFILLHIADALTVKVISMSRFRIRETGSVEIDSIPHCMSETVLHVTDDDDDDDIHVDYDSDVLALNHNTWSLRCHKEQLSRMLTNAQTHGSNSILSLQCMADWKPLTLVTSGVSIRGSGQHLYVDFVFKY